MDRKQKARELRKQGYSLLHISKIVGASKSSVSLWVRDVELTDDQVKSLNIRPNLETGRLILSQKRKQEKEKWFNKGYERAKNLDPLHILVCSLYWGEGSKTQSNFAITNSDPRVLKCFISFVDSEFEVLKEDLKIHIICYDDIHTLKEIEGFWLSELGFSRKNMYKSTVNKRPSSSKGNSSKLEFGTCSVRVPKGGRYLEHILGAINYYSSVFGEPVEN